jgi:ABC-2 type transport system permease protein
MIFPIKNMPQILQWLSYIVPTRWYIDIVRKVMIQGLGWAVIWKETVILVGMSLLLVGSSILNIKSRLE